MKLLKQSTATTLLLGPFVDETDGKTAETALTISQADVLLWKEGGTTLAQKNEATSCTHRSNGLYTCPLNTTDTGTLGILTVSVHESGALPVRHDFQVVPANVYDSMVLGTDVFQTDVTQFGGTNGTFASGIPQASVSTSSINSIADQVWDEAASGHVAAGSFGQAANIIRANTAQAGASTTITLDASASAVDDFYNNQKIFITAGTGAGQGRIISDYVGATKVATVASWVTNPSSDSVFVITPFGSIPGASAPTAGEVADAVWDEARTDHVASGSFGQAGQVIRAATAQAGSSASITLDASASATDDLYNYNQIVIISGTGAGQSRQITDYVGSTKVATVGLAWTTNPSSDSVFMILPLGIDAATVASIADAIWDEARSGHVQAGSFGEYVLADATRLSGDAGAADNAEAFFDGTGYAGTNNVIPLVTATTSVTNTVNANVTQISGDSTAADNLEAALDGTGGVTISAGVTGNITGNLSGSVGSVTGAVGSVTATVSANAVQISGDSVAADNLEALLDGTGGVTLVASAVTLSTPIQANVTQISGDSAAADTLESYTDGTDRMPVDVKEINSAALTGDGAGTPWGPA